MRLTYRRLFSSWPGVSGPPVAAGAAIGSSDTSGETTERTRVDVIAGWYYSKAGNSLPARISDSALRLISAIQVNFASARKQESRVAMPEVVVAPKAAVATESNPGPKCAVIRDLQMITSCPQAVKGWRVFSIPTVINARRRAYYSRSSPERQPSFRMSFDLLARRYLARLRPARCS
jgi:hypothetical protein